MGDFRRLGDDVWLTGTLVVRAVCRRTGRPLPGRQVLVRACGFV